MHFGDIFGNALGGAFGNILSRSGGSRNAFVNALDPAGIVGRLMSSRAKDRQKQNEDNAALTSALARFSQIGAKEMSKYKKGTLTAGEQASIDSASRLQKAQLNQAFGNMGIADSTMMAEGKGDIETNAIAMKERIRERHWNNAMKALNLSGNAINTLHQMNKENMQENIQIFTGLMSVLGNTASLWGKGNTTDKDPVGGSGINVQPSGTYDEGAGLNEGNTFD